MDHFLDYATSLDPAFPSSIEGASPDEVDRVQAAADVPLPADYRKYLELMGRNDAGMITSPDELWTTASEIATFYETDREQEEYVVPDGCLVVGVGRISIELACIELEPPHRVVEGYDGRKTTLWAGSLRGMLYRNAFTHSTKKRYKRATWLAVGDRTPRLRNASRSAWAWNGSGSRTRPRCAMRRPKRAWWPIKATAEDSPWRWRRTARPFDSGGSAIA